MNLCQCDMSNIIVHLFSLDIVFDHFTIYIIHAYTKRQNENKIIQSVLRWKLEYTKAAKLQIVLTWFVDINAINLYMEGYIK